MSNIPFKRSIFNYELRSETTTPETIYLFQKGVSALSKNELKIQPVFQSRKSNEWQPVEFYY